MRPVIAITVLPLLVAACQETSAFRPPVPTAGAQTPATTATFSKPAVLDGKGPPSQAWIFASNGPGGNVDVYSAKTLKMISQCPCSGIGLAVESRSGDLAVGTKSGTVTVWHVKSKQITQFATLNLSQGPYSVGLAFDPKGDLYAANSGDNVIDFFTSSEIHAGGGAPTRTLFTSQLNEVEYLAADAHNLLADGYNRYDQALLVSVNERTGNDTIL
ncbi:MAG TPA: WD40 repeat domain-containing protein [Candidatus Cybelea sp.]|jgi:WD40 repeat protein|nr:WD40 repeat domain-containing protein [Candidatus Cybelea sp.]